MSQNEKQSSRVDVAIAYALLRCTLGANIAIHGISRLLHGPTSFAHSLVPAFHGTLLAAWMVYGFGLLLPWCEAFTGTLLFLGLWFRFACVFGMVQLIALTLGSGLQENWSAAAIQLNYALIYALLMVFRKTDSLSVDARRKPHINPWDLDILER